MDASVWHERITAGGAKEPVPPHFAQLLERPHLLRLVRSLPGGGVVSLVAGPGYGKTAFLSQLVDDFPGRRFYCSMAEHPGRAEALVDWAASCIGSGEACVGQLSFQFGLPIGPALGPVSGAASDEILLMFDDLHVYEAGPAGDGFYAKLQALCDRLPARWLVCLSSRAEPPVSLSRQAAQGRVLSVTSRRLRFTPKEVSTWARQLLGVSLRTEDARALWRHTQGWPVALSLIASALKSADRLPDEAGMGRLLAKNRELHEYVEANVLAGLSPDARLILEKCSPLAQVSFPQDAAFFGEGACLAQEVLTDLSVRGHLVHSSGGQVFRVHPLVREQTREGLERADPPSYQETVRDAAHHLERYGDLERAVSLYLSIGADAEASAVLHRLAVSFLNASISMAKPEWLLRLPEDLLHRDPSLLLVKGRILQAQGSFEEAAAAFRKAARHFEHTSGSEGLVQALLSEAFCLYMQGRWDDSLKVLDRAEKAGTSPAERVEILCSKGNVLLGQCRWDEAVEKWESALAAVAESERPVLEGRIFSYRTRLFYLRGNYRASVEWARRSVKAASGKVDPAYAVALNVCATALYTVGLYEEAQMRAQAAEALVRARGWAFLECPVHLTLAGIAQGEGRYGEAVKHLQSTRADTQRMGDMEAHVWAEQTLGDVCRLNRNPARAEEHHRTALALIDQHQLAVFERARALWGLGADLAVLGKDEEAAATLDQAVAMCRTWGLGGTLAQALFYQGWLKAKENKEPLAARVLAEAVDLLEGGGNVHFLLQESAVAVPILALCDRLGVGSYLSTHIVPRLPDRLRRYYIRLAYGATYPTDLALGRPIGSRFAESRAASFPEPQVEPELVERFTALTARELEILRLISLGMPNKVIAARLFITEKTIKTHTNRMYKKLGVLNRLQAVLAFQRYLRQPQERRSQD